VGKGSSSTGRNGGGAATQRPHRTSVRKKIFENRIPCVGMVEGEDHGAGQKGECWESRPGLRQEKLRLTLLS